MKTIDITLSSGEKRTVRLSGEFERFGERWGVHRTPLVDPNKTSKRWSVSHIGTGASITPSGGYSTRALAEAGAQAVLDIRGEEVMLRAIRTVYSTRQPVNQEK